MKIKEILIKILVRICKELPILFVPIISCIMLIFSFSNLIKIQDPNFGAVGSVIIGQFLFTVSLNGAAQIYLHKGILKEMNKEMDDLRFALKVHEEALKSLKK
jgi:hypothetical protein